MDVAREPFALTLWSFYQIADHERIMALAAKFGDWMRARLTNFAVCAPERLESELIAIRSEAGLLPSPEESVANAVRLLPGATAAVQAMMAEEAAEAGT